jgi:hypothetical protein
MLYELIPNKQIGPLALGMKREEVHKLLQEPFTYSPAEWIDDEEEPFLSPAFDYFETTDAKIEYNEQEEATFIEIGPLSSVVWLDVSVFATSAAQLISMMQAIDSSCSSDDYVVMAPALGMAVCLPEDEDLNKEPVTLISIFSAEAVN